MDKSNPIKNIFKKITENENQSTLFFNIENNNINNNENNNINNNENDNENDNENENENENDNENDNENENLQCAICYDSMNFINNECSENNPIKLDCNHTFHYKCILMTFKTNLINNKFVTRCPFCRKKNSYIPLQNNQFPIRNIHAEYELIKKYLHKGDFKKIYELAKKYNFLNENKCNAIVTTGNNKGTQCKKSKQKDTNFCFIHKKKFSDLLNIN
jgi:hypothetical protein